MKRTPRVILAKTGLAVLVIMALSPLPSCSQLNPEGSGLTQSFPPFPMHDRVTSGGQIILSLKGSDVLTKSDNVIVDGTGGSSTLVAASEGVSWVIYRFSGLAQNSNVEFCNIGLDGAPTEDLPDVLYVGLADFEKNRWEWKILPDPPAAWRVPADDVSMISPNGNCYVAVLAWDNDYCTVTNTSLDSTGDGISWSHSWATLSDEVIKSCVIGESDSIFTLLQGPSNWTLLSYDATGNQRFSLTSEFQFDAADICVDPELGFIYIVGQVSGNFVVFKLGQGGQFVWAGSGYSDPPGQNIFRVKKCSARNGQLLIAGSFTNNNAGDPGGALMLISDTGVKLWSKQTDIENYFNESEVAIDSSGNIYWSGGNPSDSAYLLKLDSSGNILWQKRWTSSTTDDFKSLVIDNQDRAILAGSIESGTRFAMLAYTSTGTLIRQFAWGSNGSRSCYSVATNSNGEIALLGSAVGFETSDNRPFAILFNNDLTVRSTNYWTQITGSNVLGSLLSDGSLYMATTATGAVDQNGASLGNWAQPPVDETQPLSGQQPLSNISVEDSVLMLDSGYPADDELPRVNGIKDTGGGGQDALLLLGRP